MEGYVQFVSTSDYPVPLALPPYESVPLARSPLILVAAQINFEDVGELAHAQGRAFQKAFGDKFWTSLQPAQQVRFSITPNGAVQDSRRSYQFQSADGSWSATLNSDCVVIETRKYGGWPELEAKLQKAAEAVADVLDPSQCLRLGLRYIDQVQLPPHKQSWDGLINDAVRGLVNSTVFGSSILGSDQRHLLMLENDVRCMLHHGLLAQDDTIELGSVYLLDYDVFQDTPLPFEPVDIGSVGSVLHDYVGALFRASVEPELYAWLKGDE